jgi:hypothetical protein
LAITTFNVSTISNIASQYMQFGNKNEKGFSAVANGETGEKLQIRFRRFCRRSPQMLAKIAKKQRLQLPHLQNLQQIARQIKARRQP